MLLRRESTGDAGFSTWPCSSPGGLPGRTRAAFGRGTNNSKRTISPHVASQHEAAWSRPHDDGLPNGSASRCGRGPCAHVSPVLPRAQATASHPIIVLDMAAWPDGRRHGRRAAVPALIQTLWPSLCICFDFGFSAFNLLKPTTGQQLQCHPSSVQDASSGPLV